MAKQVVVGPDLTLDWDKYRNIMHELHGQIGRGVLTLDHLQAIVEHRNPFEVAAVAQPKAEVVQSVRSVDELLADWVNFYRDVFGEEVDFSGLRVPERRKGFDRLIVVAKDMSPERVFQKCQEQFHCWKYTDRNLDEIVFDANGLERKYRRSDHETHAVWVRDRVESDDELKNRSADNLANAKIPGITLEARELYELKYFKETGKHLDRRNWTLCSGSQNLSGGVPGVDWCGVDDKMYVDWYRPAYSRGDLCSREQVS